ncbi:MAG: TonB-dependent receptor [Bacteroidaceae bacterium]|nr:TonB-dependent receptor [Bacteroidaceae bacterium]
MKKILLLVAATATACSAWAQQSVSLDSLDYAEMDEVQVIATRATKTTPVAFTNVTKEQIKKVNFGKDLPEVLSMTPSVVTTSDAGAGVGYTTMRIRGTDGSRINVTVNGIPINDAESHNVFWVNMPDLLSSLKSIQIQRGVGTSTNGAGAFGASVNMVTTDFSDKPYAEVAGSYGSFNTNKQTVKVGSGLLGDHWCVDARLSHIGSDGFLDRASVRLFSYYVQAGYYSGSTSVKFVTFGGKERTYHAWNYPSKEETAEFGRSYNSCGYMYTDASGRRHYYDDQTDNYFQHHYQLLFSHQFNARWTMNAAAHYTKGDGYYQEYILSADLATYKLPEGYSDITRKKVMDNGFGGGVFDLTYKNDRLQTTFGGGMNKYTGWNFGNVLSTLDDNHVATIYTDNEFYRYRGEKWDGNLYLKADYNLCKGLNGYVDLQWRHIDYRLRGENERWDYAAGAPQDLNITRVYDFFNPKVGLNYQFRKHHRVYASWSVAHKEPTRNNFITDLSVQPVSERLFDYEAGYEFRNDWLHAGANLYYMDYKDQLVLTGKLNEIGEPLSENVPESYRLGAELSFGLKTRAGFSWDVSATLSRNRVKDFQEVLPVNEYDADGNWIGSRNEVVDHGETHLAFSPDYTFVNIFRYTIKGFETFAQTNFVSKQYMCNANQEDCTLDTYCTTNLAVSYTWKNLRAIKGLTVGCTVYNLFNAKYDNNGWASSEHAYVGGADMGRVNYSGYAAQAGTNVLGHVSLQF